GLYKIEEPAQWIRETTPYLNRLVTVLKYATPLIGPWLGTLANVPAQYQKNFENAVKSMQELVKDIPAWKERPDAKLAASLDVTADPERVEGPALRALRALLDKKDPQHQWGGLRKVITPEGHILWLCDYHAQQYRT